MDAKDTTLLRGDQKKELSQLLEMATKALKLAKSYQTKAKASTKKTQVTCEKLESAHQSLELIVSVLKKQIQDAEEMARRLKTQCTFMAGEVDKLIQFDEDIMKQLHKSLLALQKKKIHQALYKEIPASLPENQRTFTLFDWVGIDDVNERKSEALQEIAELQKLSNYLKITVKKIETKYDYVLTSVNTILNSVTDYRMTDAKEKLAMQKNEMNAINAMALSIASHCDRLNFALKQSSLDQAGDYNLAGLRQATEGLSSQISQIYDCLQRVDTIAKEFDERAKKYDAIFAQSTSLNDLLDLFGRFCESVSVELRYLEYQFKQHKNGYAPLFNDLKALASFYQMFAVSYQEMLFEIARRRAELKRQQEIVNKYQRELDSLYQREQRSRENFHQFWGQYLPSSICPALFEPPPRYRIYPENFETSLPNVEDVIRSATHHFDRTLGISKDPKNNDDNDKNPSSNTSSQNSFTAEKPTSSQQPQNPSNTGNDNNTNNTNNTTTTNKTNSNVTNNSSVTLETPVDEQHLFVDESRQGIDQNRKSQLLECANTKSEVISSNVNTNSVLYHDEAVVPTPSTTLVNLTASPSSPFNIENTSNIITTISHSENVTLSPLLNVNTQQKISKSNITEASYFFNISNSTTEVSSF